MFKLQDTIHPGKEKCRQDKNKYETSGKMRSGRIQAAEEVLKELHLRIQKAEKLLGDIKNTGSHHQINKKIDEYFTELDDAKRSPG